MVNKEIQNKIKYFAGKATLVHTVDTFKKALMINDFCLKKDLFQDILLQVNVSEDPNKGGARIEEVQELSSSISILERLKIKGLMTITEYSQDPERQFREQSSLSQSEFPSIHSPRDRRAEERRPSHQSEFPPLQYVP